MSDSVEVTLKTPREINNDGRHALVKLQFIGVKSGDDPDITLPCAGSSKMTFPDRVNTTISISRKLNDEGCHDVAQSDTTGSIAS